MSVLRHIRGILAGGIVVAVSGCAGGGALRLADVTPASIPALESQRAAHPRDVAVLARLGVAYFRAERYGDAKTVFDTAQAIDRTDGLSAIYLGMTAEQLGDFEAARAAYARYIEIGQSGELRDAARQRLALVGRRELEFQARAALAAESTLTTRPPDANTIAVMPFTYTGTNQEIAPLSRGLAQLVVTDLARSRQITVLERDRMQAMLDEMRLSAAGQADPQTAVRSGRMLRAERVVQGAMSDRDGELRVDAAVVDVTTAGVRASAGVNDRLERLFDLEKQLVYSIFQNLGIQLSDAERAAIEQRPTSNLAAFLAYSQGLEAEDRGDFDAARDAYNQAAVLDPSFSAAAAGAAAAGDLSSASGQTVQQVDVAVVANTPGESGGGGVSDSERRDALTNATNSVSPTTATVIDDGQSTVVTTPPPNRDTGAEGTGTEGPKPATGTVVIIIRRP